MRNDKLIRLLAGYPASADITIWTGDDETGAQDFEPILLVEDMDDGKAGEMIGKGEPWLGSSLGRLDEQSWGHLSGALDQLFENMRTPEEIAIEDAEDDEPIESPEQTDAHRAMAAEWVERNPLLCAEFERTYRRKPELPHECRVAYALSTGGGLWMRDNDDVAWVEVRREDLADIHLDEIGPSQMHCSVPTIEDWDTDDGVLRSWDKPGCAVVVAIRIGEWPIFSELNRGEIEAMDACCPSPYALESVASTIKRVEPFADAGDIAWPLTDQQFSEDGSEDADVLRAREAVRRCCFDLMLQATDLARRVYRLAAGVAVEPTSGVDGTEDPLEDAREEIRDKLGMDVRSKLTEEYPVEADAWIMDVAVDEFIDWAMESIEEEHELRGLDPDELHERLRAHRMDGFFGDDLEEDYAEGGVQDFGPLLGEMTKEQMIAELLGEDEPMSTAPEPRAVEATDALAERLEAMFWAEVAAASPTADGGDWPPDPALDVKWHMRAWIAKWRRLNTPEGRTIDDELGQESALISVLPVDYDGIRAAAREPWFDPQGWTEQMWADEVGAASEKLDDGVNWRAVWGRAVRRALGEKI